MTEHTDAAVVSIDEARRARAGRKDREQPKGRALQLRETESVVNLSGRMVQFYARASLGAYFLEDRVSVAIVDVSREPVRPLLSLTCSRAQWEALRSDVDALLRQLAREHEDSFTFSS